MSATNKEFMQEAKIVRLKKELEAAQKALEAAEAELKEMSEIRAEQEILKSKVEKKRLIQYVADVARCSELKAEEIAQCRDLLTRKQLDELKSDLKVSALI